MGYCGPVPANQRARERTFSGDRLVPLGRRNANDGPEASDSTGRANPWSLVDRPLLKLATERLTSGVQREQTIDAA
jgi:hypothetical protein